MDPDLACNSTPPPQFRLVHAFAVTSHNLLAELLQLQTLVVDLLT